MKLRIVCSGVFVVCFGLLGAAWAQQWDTVHTTVYVTENVTVSADTTLSAPAGGGSGVAVDSADSVVTIADTVFSIDTLTIGGGVIIIDGEVICNAFKSTGGSIAPAAAHDTLHVMGDADFSGLTNDSVDVTVYINSIMDASDRKIVFKHGDKVYQTVILWAFCGNDGIGELEIGPGALHTRGDLVLKWNSAPGGNNAKWDFDEYDPDVTVEGDVIVEKIEAPGGNSLACKLGDGEWTLYGDAEFPLAYGWGNSATIVFAGDGVQRAKWGRRLYDVRHTGDGTLLIDRENAGMHSFAQTNGVLALDSVDTMKINADLAISGGSVQGAPGVVLHVGGNAALSGIDADTLLDLVAAEAWELNVQGVLQASHTALKNCNATGSPGVAFASADIGGNVNWTFYETDQPVISVQPQSDTVLVGDSAILHVGAAALSPLSYEWYRDSAAIADSDTKKFVLRNAAAADSGAVFFVVAKDTAGNADTSVLCTVTVIDPPRIESAVSGTESAYVGENIELSVDALGAGPLTYLWHKNDEIFDSTSGALMVLDSVTKEDDGDRYFCVVSTRDASYSDYSDTSRSARIRVRYPLTITSQPEGMSVDVGEAAAFSVAAVCDTTIRYQWYFNGSVIEGANDSAYGIDAVTEDDFGEYYCELSWEDKDKETDKVELQLVVVGVLPGRKAPVRFMISSNAPNPFRNSTRIAYGIPSCMQVSATVYDVHGRLVRTLIPGQLYNPGYYALRWDGVDGSGRRCAPGHYLIRIRAGDKVKEQSIVLMR